MCSVANRSAAMMVVTDSAALIGLSGDGVYAKESTAGKLNLNFTNGSFAGTGFNPQANSEFHKVFTVTNQSADPVYVWLEADGRNYPPT